MDSIGAEVGQKMRSAIKAKLMELDCYVDDELPDYIMVMVANRRTKSQMNEDLNLFLASKTSTFVNWLHIVLKKLKEVTVTNPEVYKKAAKRKTVEVLPDDKSNLRIKKEKGHQKVKIDIEIKKPCDENLETNQEVLSNCATDCLPVTINKLAEKRKIIVTNDILDNTLSGDIAEDTFDIPLLSEVSESSNEQELKDIEKKIRNVKSRLGILVQSDNDEANINLKSEVNVEVSKEVDQENYRILANSRQVTILDEEKNEPDLINESEFESSKSVNFLPDDRDIEIENEIGNDRRHKEEDVWIEKRTQHKRITFESTENVSANSGKKLSERLGEKLGNRSSSRDSTKDSGKKISVLDRLGKRSGSPDNNGIKKFKLSQLRQEEKRYLGFHSEEQQKRRTSQDRDRDRNNRLSRERSKRSRSRSRDRSPYRSREARNEGILSRLGVQSKVAVIRKPEINRDSDEEDAKIIREVPSLIKVKPRVIPSDMPQPNKNLLLKAVADAQRSIAQTPKVGKEVKPGALYTKKYKEKVTESTEQKEKDSSSHKLPTEEKLKLKSLIQQSSNRMRSRMNQSSDEYDSDGEYVPKPVNNIERALSSYTPPLKTKNEQNNKEMDSSLKENGKQQFIITLDGIDKIEQSVFGQKKMPVELRLEDKKSPSPIIFDKTRRSIEPCTRMNIPDKLPIVHPPLSVKNKERCKYWPGCRQGDKCEFVHPSQNCEMFPLCKFGDKCLFIHPKCKFGSSCTKRDCPYDHNILKSANSSKLPTTAPLQNCKFFPNCTNISCPFYHPKPCKYGKYCKNIYDCTFSHNFVGNKKSLSWKSK